MPLKENHATLADNFVVARKRLDSLLTRLKSKPEILERYHKVIQEQIEAGVVETVDESQVSKIPGSVYYSPNRKRFSDFYGWMT